MLFVDYEDAEIVNNLKGEAFIVDGSYDLAADGSTELVSFLNNAELPEDLLGPILDIIGVVVKER